MIVPGDAEGCGALGLVLQRAASGVGQSQSSLAAASSGTASWQGPAGQAWRATEDRQQAAASDLSAAMYAAGTALVTFASSLVEAQSLAARARSSAAAAGLSISATGAVPAVHVPYGPYISPEQQEQAREAQRRAEARGDVLRLVQAARSAERDAHDQLLRDLRGVDAPRATVGSPVAGAAPEGRSLPRPGWSDWLDLANGLLLAPSQAHDRATETALARGAFAKSIKGATGAGSPAARAAARQEWRAALRQMRAAQAAANRHAVTSARLQPATGWLSWANKPIARGVPVARLVPGLAVVMTGVGVGVDVRGGMDPTHAVVKNVSSTGAGMVVGAAVTGLAATALTGGAIAAAPIVIGVAAGAVVAYGVGWVVGEYGDDVAGAVGDVAGEAADLTGRVWGRLTG
jgi:hypothetical protein